MNWKYIHITFYTRNPWVCNDSLRCCQVCYLLKDALCDNSKRFTRPLLCEQIVMWREDEGFSISGRFVEVVEGQIFLDSPTDVTLCLFSTALVSSQRMSSLCTTNVWKWSPLTSTSGFSAQHRGFTEPLLKICRVQLLSIVSRILGV